MSQSTRGTSWHYGQVTEDAEILLDQKVPMAYKPMTSSVPNDTDETDCKSQSGTPQYCKPSQLHDHQSR
jgi:hypothetical protein